MIKEIEYIAELIYRHKLGIQTKEETNALKEWSKNSSVRLNWFNKLQSENIYTTHEKLKIRYDSESAFNIVRNRHRSYIQRKKRIRIYQFVAASTVFFFGITVSLFQHEINHSQSPTVITAGESRATLILENGEELSLHDKLQDTLELGTFCINASGKNVQYSTINTEPSKAVAYNTLKVPRKGEFQLTLADGTHVWLNSESQLRYPTIFYGTERRVFLEGEAYFEITEDKNRPFVVEMSKAKIEVLGTSFNARAYGDEDSISATLVEGSVVMIYNEQHTTLFPNERAVLDLTSGQIETQQIDVFLYTAWRCGRFVFCGQTLEEIMNTLSRWYDIHVFFESEQVKHVTFTGNIPRYENFDKIIKMLEITQLAHFKIQGNTVVIGE